MSSRTALDRLCQHYHIASEYQDIWGKRHLASEQTRRALLAAMGVLTETGEVMQQALARAEAADWRRALPPVQVVWEDKDSIRVQVGVAETQASHQLRWLLVQEDGKQHSGVFRPADLDLSGQQALQGETWQRRVLRLSCVPGSGYHRLELHDPGQPDTALANMSLIVAPRSCYQPEAVRNGGRVWGPAVQLYAVRSVRNWVSLPIT